MSKGKIWRGFFYCLGLLVLAFGISLNTKTNLGVSSLISDSYSVAYICSANFGNMTLLWYVVITIVISLIFAGEIVGTGLGTIMAVIGVGRVVAVYNHFFKEAQLKHSGIS